jgi:adenylate cyclase
MSNEEPTLTPSEATVLFADIAGWTSLVSRLGAEAAVKQRDALFASLEHIVRYYSGTVVETIGDELMCLFDAAPRAGRAACEMQRHAERVNRESDEPILLRMGMHTGPVLRNRGIAGDTVNVAARVVAVTGPERILLTHAAAECIGQAFCGMLRQWRSEAFKGKEQRFELLELQWREDESDSTTIGTARTWDSAGTKRLLLECQGKLCILESGKKPVTFGRGPHNDLVVHDPRAFVSGTHGKIEITGGQMILTDTSRNGIYISFTEGQYFLIEKVVALRGSGRMTLGRPPHDTEAIIADFSIE